MIAPGDVWSRVPPPPPPATATALRTLLPAISHAAACSCRPTTVTSSLHRRPIAEQCRFLPIPAGYTTDQLAAGFQLATGLLIMMACFGWPRAWEALTLKSAAITPVYAVVTFCVVLQANLGEAGAGKEWVLGVCTSGTAAEVCPWLAALFGS